MTVKEAVHQLLQEFESLSDCTFYIAHDLDLAIDNLIAAVRKEEHAEPADVEQARLDSIRYEIWAAYLKTLYELLATGMKKAEATAVMGELPKFYGDALPIKETP